MEEKTSIDEENCAYKISVDNYCNLIIEMKDDANNLSRDSTEDVDWNEAAESTEEKHLIENLNFANFVKEKSDGTKRLSLHGKDLFLRRGKRLRDEDVSELLIFLEETPEVIDLDLPFNEIHCDGFIDIINYLTDHEQIMKLDVRNNEIGGKGINFLCERGSELPLEILWLNGNKFGAQSSKQLALMLLKNQRLRELNVAQTDQTASSLVYFISVLRHDQDSYNETLKTLDISSPNPGCFYYFDTAHFATLIGSLLKTNECLENLYLEKFGFTCHDIELMLMEGKLNRTLRTLDLSGNNIGDFGIEFLSDWLAQKPGLSVLVLAHNIVTSTGARALNRGLPFSRVKHLDIAYNRIEDSGIRDILDTLKKSPCLRSLKLFGNCIGHESSKIINRMLLSGVLVQEHLDVRPYRVNHEWQCALYSEEN